MNIPPHINLLNEQLRALKPQELEGIIETTAKVLEAKKIEAKKKKVKH